MTSAPSGAGQPSGDDHNAIPHGDTDADPLGGRAEGIVQVAPRVK
jgi:hypothetical protein